jgi:AraC family transcriptional regulator
LAKIAAELDRALAERVRNGTPGRAEARVLARGEGWRVEDVVCTSGPRDRPFEERHQAVGVAIVAAGSFQYRSPAGRQLMTPGSLLLGNAGQDFECAHDHGTGDRCLAFQLEPDYFERLAADAGARPRFRSNRLPPLRDLAPFVARALAGLETQAALRWEELGLHLVTRAVRVMAGVPADPREPAPAALARVTPIVRGIDRQPDGALTLAGLAREAGLSPYHFLRTFESVTGVTPHQYVLRARLRQAALRLAGAPARIGDIALDCGFGDVSNFNRAFRAEFGVSPRAYRASSARWMRGRSRSRYSRNAARVR